MNGRFLTMIDIAKMKRLHAEGLTHAVVAERIGCSARTVMKKLQALGIIAHTPRPPRTTPTFEERVAARKARKK